MIPKVIHFCWFGGKEKPESVKKNIDNWKKVLDDYEIIERNEDNFDINSNNFVKQAYEAKKFAFVSDYVRLKVLYEYGGIYLDTDVIVVKNFDEFLNLNAFCSFESSQSICTAVIGAEKGSAFIEKTLLLYANKTFVNNENKYDLTPNSELIFKHFFKEKVDRCTTIELPEITFFPVDYFCAKDYKTYEYLKSKNTVCIHDLYASWYTPKKKFLRFIKKILIKIGLKGFWKE